MNRATTLLWNCKTPKGWRRFPVVKEKEPDSGLERVKRGFVVHDGREVEYPQGHWEIRQYNSDRKPVYTRVENTDPRNVIAVDLRRAARRLAETRGNPLQFLKKAAAQYVKELTSRKVMASAAEARWTLGTFLPLCTTSYVLGLTRADILKFHAVLRKQGLAERTIANKHDRLKAFIRYAGGDLNIFPKRPKYEKGLPTIYTSAEVADVLAAADDYLRLVLMLCLKCGLREQEVTHLEWSSDIHWDDSVLRVQGKPYWQWKVKDNEARDVPISSDLLKLLRSRRTAFPNTRLIVGTSKDKPNQHYLRALKRLVRRSGLACSQCQGCLSQSRECSNWTLHKFRRTFCTTLLRNGVDVSTVKAWAGHSDLKTTMRYLRPASAIEMQDRVNAVVW